MYLNFTNSAEWQVQPDAILETKFKKTPNIYYIQPDGYANETNLKGPLYQFDNSEFDGWLKDNKFTLYDDYRSNYPFYIVFQFFLFFYETSFFK